MKRDDVREILARPNFYIINGTMTGKEKYEAERGWADTNKSNITTGSILHHNMWKNRALV